MGFFIKSQNEIDKERRLKTALGLANRAMRPGTKAEGEACASQLKKHMAKHGISDADLVEYARQESRGGRKSERQADHGNRQGRGGGGSANSDGFYYRDKRDKQRETEEAEFKKWKEQKARREAEQREANREKREWQAQQKQRANDEWNANFERKHGKPTTRSGWRPENRLSREKTTGEKVVGIINSFFGV